MWIWFGHEGEVCHSGVVRHIHVVLSVLSVGRHFVSSIENGARKVPEAEAVLSKAKLGGR